MQPMVRCGLALAMAMVAGAAMGQTVAPVAPAVTAPVAGTATAPVAPAAGASFLSQVTDPATVAMGAYIFSQVAQGATNYKVTLGGRAYNLSGAQATALTAGSVIGLAGVIHKWPKSKTAITIGLGVVSAMLGAKSYYNSLNHGAVTAPAASGTAVAQFRRGGK